MAICWTLLKRIAFRNNDLFKNLNLMRILSVDDFPQNCRIEDDFLSLDYLENKPGEIDFNAYLISISEIVSSCTLKGNGAVLLISGYTLAILWGRKCFFIFDSHSIDSSGRIIVNGTAVLLKFIQLYHLDDDIKRTYFQKNSSSVYVQV